MTIENARVLQEQLANEAIVNFGVQAAGARTFSRTISEF